MKLPPALVLRPARVALVAVVGAAAGVAAFSSLPGSAAPPERPRVLVLGFDGLSADRVEKLDAEGRLPNLKSLRERGGYSRMLASNPAQSPVSWASIITGWNPGKTGIYDFLRRRDLDPTQIDIAIAEPVETRPLGVPVRVLLVLAAGVLGAVAGGAVAFAVSMLVRAPSWRGGKPMEISLSLGAAAFAAGAFVVLGWVPEKVPTARNLRSGEPFWVTLDRAGVRCVALEGPLCFPPEEMHAGCCLAGLGVPDMMGTWGSYSVWSDDPAVPQKTETAASGYHVEPDATSFDVVVAGPKDPLADAAAVSRARAEASREKGRRELSLEWTRRQRRASETKESLLLLEDRLRDTIRIALTRGEGATATTSDGATVALRPGVWSDLLPVTFRGSPVVQLRGRVRLLLEDAGSAAPSWRPFRLFVGQVQWDPSHVPPNVALSSPRTFAAELGAEVGPFETIGWPEMTNPVKDGLLTDEAFLAHTYLLMRQRERKLASRLARNDWDVLFAMFSEPDRVQHALYRHVDPQCPTHDPEAAEKFAGEIDRIYVEADRIVGEAVAAAGPDTIVLVVSDHGFAPFRTGVNLNNLLRAKGWQSGSRGVAARSVAELGAGSFFDDVDWSATKAYSMGLGNLYLNLRGREPTGSVAPEDADATLAAISKALLELRDADGSKVVRNVYLGKDIYRGARSREAPDLVVGFEWGYRVSWQNCLGGLDPDVITPNTQGWSGDHCSVDPELVPAVFFSSLPLAPGARPAVEDVAPTVLGLYGVAAPDTDGRSVLAR